MPSLEKPRGLTPEEKEIHDLADFEFSLAKRWWSRFIFFQLMVAAFSLVTLVSTQGYIIASSTVILLILQLTTWFCQWKTSQAKSQANQAHRSLHILYGLNEGITKDEVAFLKEGFSIEIGKLKTKSTPYYFYCHEPPSHMALLRCIEETAFYLNRLYKSAAKIFFWATAICVCILLISFIVISFSVQVTAGLPLIAAKFVIVTLSFWAATDILGSAMAYSNASKSLLEISHRIENLIQIGQFDAQGNTTSQVGRMMSLLVDFHAISEQAPLIFDFLHQSQRLRLAALWQQKTHNQVV